MAVRSKQLVARLSGPAGFTLFYTAPPGETVLVKWVNLAAVAGSAGRFRLQLSASSGPWLTLLDVDLAFGDSVSQETWWVLKPGDVLRGNSVTEDRYAVLISGAELEGVAD